MKKLLLLLIIPMLFFNSCDDDDLKTGYSEHKIILLKVDYMTQVLEGSAEFMVEENIYEEDSIPIMVNYNAPGDFGGLKLYYNNELNIFDGTIIWMGLGEISVPEYFTPSNELSTINTSITFPKLDQFNTIFYQLKDPIPYSQIWGAIDNLEVVASYINSTPEIKIFLYTPSVGVGNPYDWDWFVIMTLSRIIN